ncbi:hypothetical protein N9140_00355 [bacterium]|nr:hypothetical protein [bacterium]
MASDLLLINDKRFDTYRFITTLRVVVKADDDANLPINRTSGIRAFIDEVVVVGFFRRRVERRCIYKIRTFLCQRIF